MSLVFLLVAAEGNLLQGADHYVALGLVLIECCFVVRTALSRKASVTSK